MDVNEEDMIKYHNCREKYYAGKCYGRETCKGCEFDLPIDKFRYISS